MKKRDIKRRMKGNENREILRVELGLKRYIIKVRVKRGREREGIY